MHTLIIIAVACCALAGAWWLIVRRKLSIEKTIVIAAAVLGLCYNLIMPPGMVPDETAHVQTAYRYSNVMLFTPFAADDGGLYVRQEDAWIGELGKAHDVNSGMYDITWSRARLFISEGGNAQTVIPARSVSTGFIAYIPTAIGITLSRICQLSTVPMLYLARLLNLLCYVLCLHFAIRLTPVKKFLFAISGITPMALQIVCSFSYDASIVGLALLSTAYLLRLVYKTEAVDVKHWIIVCVLAFLLVPCKFIYSPIFLLLFFLPNKKCGSMGKKVLLIGLVALCGVVGFVLNNLPTLLRYLSAATSQASSGTRWDGTPLYSVGWVLSHPYDTVQIFLHSIRQYFDFYWSNMIGGRLSVFEPVLNWSLFILVVLVLSAMRDPDDPVALSGRVRAVSGVGFVLMTLGAMLSMLVMYTPFGSEVIEGVQGRYLLPMLPLGLAALGSNNITLTDGAKRWLTVLMLTFNAAAWMEVLLWILQRIQI